MALETILDDKYSVTPATNQAYIDQSKDYADFERIYRKATKEFGTQKESGKFCGSLPEYMAKHNIIDLKDKTLTPYRNYHLLKNELEARQRNGSRLAEIAIDISDLDRSLSELSESIENTKLIQEVYRARKQTTKDDGGISVVEAAKIKHCFYQGRELYKSGTTGSLLVKPLNYFYALTAYTYGIIILNNPTRFRKDMLPGSHGINYLPDSVEVQFGGDMPRGTFSDLHTSFPQNLIRGFDTEIMGSSMPSLIALYRNRVTCSLGTLLSLVPEMAEFYKIATGRDSRVHKLSIVPSRQVRDPSISFQIGNGIKRPSPKGIEQGFPGCRSYEEGGRINVVVERERVGEIQACIYTDINGRLWFIDDPFHPTHLPEVCLHFLILAIFSNIMRYRPDEWGGLVDNDVSANVSMATRHYFSVLERKFNVIILRNASLFFPYAPEAGVWY